MTERGHQRCKGDRSGAAARRKVPGGVVARRARRRPVHLGPDRLPDAHGASRRIWRRPMCRPARGTIGRVGIVKYALSSNWELSSRFGPEIAAQVRERVLQELRRQPCYRDNSSRVRRASTCAGVLHPFGLFVRRPRGAPARLEAVFQGQRNDHPDRALDAVAPYSRAGSSILWRRDALEGVTLSITDGSRCANLLLPAEPNRAASMTDVLRANAQVLEIVVALADAWPQARMSREAARQLIELARALAA